MNADEQNPYQSPSFGPQGGNAPPTGAHREMIKKFRDQIHALGALWILSGGFALGLVGIVLAGSPGFAKTFGEGPILLVVVAVMGLLWLIVGVMTCLKHMGAVYTGLILSYVSLVGQLLNINLCAIIISVIVILQGHRVIGWAKKLQAAGIPLTAKP